MPQPLGMTLGPLGANFAIWSQSATAIELCLFDDKDFEIWRQPLPHKRSDVFYGFIDGLQQGQRYGIRAHGHWLPEQGHYYDPSKVLLDPYAVSISGNFDYHPELSARGVDTASRVPKAIATPPAAPSALRTPSAPSLIYELNVRGFSKLHPDVPLHKRGTLAALAEPAIIEHFKTIGANTIELMPIAAWIDERHLVQMGLRNAWGYNPVSMFAVDPRLLSGAADELRDTVDTLHAHNLNVILDVVFNHTGESDALGPIVSCRGIDNASYYRMFHGHFINDAGTGNTLALDRPHTVQWIVDVMRHWVLTYGIDGFRFDLASIMGRSETGFSATAPLLTAIENDSVLSSRILIAEPWDIGPGGYQLGNFPPHWFEWNDTFRDDVRRFWRGDNWSANAMATRLAGSSDKFAAKRRPSRSINFISAHDGFTLQDLLTFSEKQNLANGENNRDGKSHEVTCIGSNAVALLSSLLFSRGTPMLAAGDEFGRTQAGNNNAYAQDNETTWLNWLQRDLVLQDSFANLVKLRHQLDNFFGDHFLTGQPLHAQNEPDVVWRDKTGQLFDWSKPENHVLCMILSVQNQRLCVALNNGTSPAEIDFSTFSTCDWKPLSSISKTVNAHSVAIFQEAAAP
jgi:glycogen debranching enzyme